MSELSSSIRRAVRKIRLWINMAMICMTSVSIAAPLQLVSSINPSLSPPFTPDGDSWNPVISADGRFVLFSSRAENIALGASNALSLAQVPARMNVFIRDRANQTTTLVSVNLAGTGGGNGDSIPMDISTNGQFALFESTADNLVPGDANGNRDVFIRDLAHGTTTLVSVNTKGVSGNGPSHRSVMTPDGRFVAFSSRALDLVPGNTNAIPAAEVFVRDQQAGVTTLASSTLAGQSIGAESPEITPDGRYVAFLSVAASPQTYVRDLVAGNTGTINYNSDSSTNLICYNHVLSDDGQFVACEYSSSLLPLAILRFNLQTSNSIILSTAPVQPNSGFNDFRNLDMTTDGRFIAFVARTGTNSGSDIYVWDAQKGTNALVTGDSTNNLPTASACDWPVLDPTGRFVIFLCTATNLTTNVVTGTFHLYLRDLRTGAVQLLDQDTNGTAMPRDFLTVPRLTPDGRFVAFDCTGGDLANNDGSQKYNVFIRDLIANSNELISIRQPASPSQSAGGGISGTPIAVSGTGRFIAFAGSADNLTANYTNALQGVFVGDLLLGINALASVDTNGLAGANGNSTAPVISADGRYVAFTSSAQNLVPGDTNTFNTSDVFLRDLQTGTTSLVSVNTSGNGPGNGSSLFPLISGDGRYVLFCSYAANLSQDNFVIFSGGVELNLYWRDMQSGITHVVTPIIGPSGEVAAPSVSFTPDGQLVVSADPYGNGYLHVWNAQAQSNIYTNPPGQIGAPENVTSAISSNGQRIAYRAGAKLYATDLPANTNWLIDPALSTPHPGLQFSGDGRFLVYATDDAQVPTDTNGTNDVYLYDFQTGTNFLVSRSCNSPSAANGPSDSPTISSDGRFVAYRSFAGDLVPGDTNSLPDVFLYDRVTGATTLVSVNASGTSSGNNRSLAPVFSGDGTTLVFQSWASDLVAGDFNQGADVFALKLYSSNSIPVFVGEVVFAPASGPSPKLTWPAVPGKSYQVQYKNNLSDPVWQNLNGSVSIAGTNGYASDFAPATSQRFYRIAAQ